MPLVMARPIKLKSSPNPHYKKRVPKDVFHKARGQVIAVPVGDEVVRVTVHEHVKFSLRTNDRRVAVSRQRIADEHVRTGSTPCEPALRH